MSGITIDLHQLGKMVGEIAEAIGKLGDSIAHIVTLGSRVWDAGQARALQARLSKMTRLLRGAWVYNGRAADSVETYIDSWERITENGLRKPSASAQRGLGGLWKQALECLQAALEEGYGGLALLQQEKSDFAFAEEFHDLFETLSARAGLLQELVVAEPSHTPEDVAQLRSLIAQYRRLRSNLDKCIDALNRYAMQASSAAPTAGGSASPTSDA